MVDIGCVVDPLVTHIVGQPVAHQDEVAAGIARVGWFPWLSAVITNKTSAVSMLDKLMLIGNSVPSCCRPFNSSSSLLEHVVGSAR